MRGLGLLLCIAMSGWSCARKAPPAPIAYDDESLVAHWAEALRPLFEPGGTGPGASAARKKWLAQVTRDKDFDRVRESPELRALIGPAAPK